LRIICFDPDSGGLDYALHLLDAIAWHLKFSADLGAASFRPSKDEGAEKAEADFDSG
jgi:hypothetical protein